MSPGGGAPPERRYSAREEEESPFFSGWRAYVTREVVEEKFPITRHGVELMAERDYSNEPCEVEGIQLSFSRDEPKIISCVSSASATMHCNNQFKCEHHFLNKGTVGRSWSDHR